MQTKRHSTHPTQSLSLKSQELIPGSVHSLDISALVQQPDDLNTISLAVYMTFSKSTPPVLSSVKRTVGPGTASNYMSAQCWVYGKPSS